MSFQKEFLLSGKQRKYPGYYLYYITPGYYYRTYPGGGESSDDYGKQYGYRDWAYKYTLPGWSMEKENPSAPNFAYLWAEDRTDRAVKVGGIRTSDYKDRTIIIDDYQFHNKGSSGLSSSQASKLYSILSNAYTKNQILEMYVSK